MTQEDSSEQHLAAAHLVQQECTTNETLTVCAVQQAVTGLLMSNK
jgi:hypothetical protein